MDMYSSSITADILNILSDGKLHKMKDIAEEVEVHINTVRKHIQSLSYRYPIETFCNGEKGRGVIMDTKYLHQGKIRSNDELQLIEKALKFLQKFGGDDVDQELLESLIQEYSLPTRKQEYKKYDGNDNQWQKTC